MMFHSIGNCLLWSFHDPGNSMYFPSLVLTIKARNQERYPQKHLKVFITINVLKVLCQFISSEVIYEFIAPTLSLKIAILFGAAQQQKELSFNNTFTQWLLGWNLSQNRNQNKILASHIVHRIANNLSYNCCSASTTTLGETGIWKDNWELNPNISLWDTDILTARLRAIPQNFHEKFYFFFLLSIY